MIVVTVVGVAAFNLLLYVVGRACGGAFTYTQSGKPSRVDASAVAFMSVVPVTIGLTLVAWLSYRRRVLMTTAMVIAPLLAVATIGLMTLPAHFDTTSTLFLATMHVALVPTTVLGLGALTPRGAQLPKQPCPSASQPCPGASQRWQ